MRYIGLCNDCQEASSRFGFGPLGTVKNPLVHPLPVFGDEYEFTTHGNAQASGSQAWVDAGPSYDTDKGRNYQNALLTSSAIRIALIVVSKPLFAICVLSAHKCCSLFFDNALMHGIA